jgi:hypothetical protein
MDEHTASAGCSPRKRLLALALACASLAAWLVPSSAGSGKPEDVTITVTQACLSDDPPAVFAAEGAIEDTGSVEYTFIGPPAGQFGITGHTIKSEAIFTGGDGTLTLRWDVMFKPTDDPNVFGEFGQWHVLAGTGAYADLIGWGRSSGFCDLRGGLASEIQVLQGGVH